MLSQLRVLAAALLLCVAGPSLAAASVPAPANAQSEIATLKAQVAALEGQRDLEKRLSAVEIQLGQASRADERQANLIALLGIIITVFLFVLTLRAPREAREAARSVATTELMSGRAEFTKLADEQRKSVDESKQRLTEVNARAAEVSEHLDEIRQMAADAAPHLEKIRQDAAKGADIVEQLGKAVARGQAAVPTEDQLKTLKAVTSESADQPVELWSVDQFKTAIGKALYVDRNWTEGERLAKAMEEVHRTDNDARLFALIGRGDAALQLKRFRDAVTAYEAAIAITTKTPKNQHELDYLWVTEHLAVCLVQLTRAAEAEVMLRGLLPHLERIDGSEGPETLTARNNLAIAILNQGRASEAEAMYLELLPIRERVDGPEASQTLSTRHNLARTLLDQGRATEAEAILRAIVPLCERVDGPKASSTLSTRSSLAVAIRDQGRAAEAEAMYRELLPLHEGVDGIDASATLTTRHNLACAILDQGRTAEAESILNELLGVREQVIGPEATVTLLTRCWWADALVRMGDVAGAAAALAPIPDLVPSNDWPPRGDATLAFVRGRVADALGDRAAADAYLTRADQIYASIYPAEHLNRVTLAAYRAARPAADGGDA